MPDSSRFALHRPEIYESLMAGERKIAALMSGSAREFRTGHELIQAGAEHPYVYYLVSGWVCRTRLLNDGRDQCILIFLPGDLFAVKSMFIARQVDRVKTLSTAVVERIAQQDLHRAFCDDADVANRCMWQVIEEERRLHDWVVSLGQGSAEERVALLLLDLRDRLKSSNNTSPDALTYKMPVTQVQLADHLGITAIHLNRVLRNFRENEIVTVRDGEVSILNLARLTAIADPILDLHDRTVAEYPSRSPKAGF